jgi:hypothetical protein
VRVRVRVRVCVRVRVRVRARVRARVRVVVLRQHACVRVRHFVTMQSPKAGGNVVHIHE